MKGKAGEKAEETMTWYQSITSKVNYAGSEGTRGGASEGERDTWQHENIHHVSLRRKKEKLSHNEYLITTSIYFSKKV